MPERFTIEQVHSSRFSLRHWKVTDTKTGAKSYLDTKRACEEWSEDVLAIESGRKEAPPVEEAKARSPTKYEGLFRGGVKVWPPEGYEFDLVRPPPKPMKKTLFD